MGDAEGGRGRGGCVVFAYGSLMNSESRRTSTTSEEVWYAVLSADAGYVREWSFRSDTGFTALGVRRSRAKQDATRAINGVLMVVGEDLAVLDEREKGYQRAQLSLEHLTCEEAQGDLAALLGGRPVWMYVPYVQQKAARDFPICQTYLDCVLNGCLEWGGEDVAEQFILSTGGWSEFFLNDSPLARRPWLHRKNHKVVDELLEKHATWTRFAERRHPEEFAATYLTGPRGSWGVPRRNQLFTGRKQTMDKLQTLFLEEHGSEELMGVTQVVVVGLGGFGKTQLATEYCHRHYGSYYGLVLWLRSEVRDTLEADMRQLAGDIGLDIKDKTTREVVEEVKAQLYRCQCPWLLVFDNLEEPELLRQYAPRGGKHGHILITTRRMLPGWQAASLQLDCFDASESLEYMRKALNPVRSSTTDLTELSSSQDNNVYSALAAQLGYLPLAMAMACAYMRRCDVTCAEYLEKYEARRHQVLDREAALLPNYPLSVASSLSLSLSRISNESTETHFVLATLSYLAPDGITKHLIHALLSQRIAQKLQKQEEAASPCNPQPEAPLGKTSSHLSTFHLMVGAGTLMVVGGVLSAMLADNSNSLSSSFRRYMVPLATASTACISGLYLHRLASAGGLPSATKGERMDVSEVGVSKSSSGGDYSGAALQELGARLSLEAEGEARSFQVDEEADRVWGLMKSYSLLSVRAYHGSMHRLLQVVIKGNHSRDQTEAYVGVCVAALRELWCFDTSDPKSWATAGTLVEHIKYIARQVALLGVQRMRMAQLLTACAQYYSVVLSQFSEAQEVLEQAINLQQAAPSRSAEILVGIAETMHELGKVLRYQAKLGQAEQYLNDALAIHQNLTHSDKKSKVAGVLHELGVLHIKRHDLPTAEEYLLQALKIRSETASIPTDLAEQAATLHQLAVCATNARPAQLDRAESLLKASQPPTLPDVTCQDVGLLGAQEALRVEMQSCQMETSKLGRGVSSDGKPRQWSLDGAKNERNVAASSNKSGAKSIAVASTLQQLGRVEIRRGQLTEARQYLHEALKIQEASYGSDLHVNVAATVHQLGVVNHNQGDLEAAAERLRDALRIRRRLYQDGYHHEIASTLRELGKVVKAQGHIAEAETLFLEEKNLLTHLLQQAQTGNDVGSGHSSNAASGGSTPSGAYQSLLQEKINGLYFLRNIAREQGDKTKAAECVSELKKLRSCLKKQEEEPHCLEMELSSCSATIPAKSAILPLSGRTSFDCMAGHPIHAANSKPEGSSDLKALLNTAIACRHAVRNSLRASKSKSAGLDEEARKAVIALKAQIKQTRKSEPVAPSGPAGTRTGQDKDTPEACGQLAAVAEQFHQEVSEWFVRQPQGRPPEGKSALFKACDRLRDSLRKLGVRLEDRISLEGRPSSSGE